MSDPTHQEDSQIDRALGKDWPEDPRYAPKTLTEVAAEFRGMMEDAIRQNHFEVAVTCKQFLRAVEAADETIKRLNAELVDRAAKDPVRHCFSREEAVKVAEAWLVNGCPNIPMAGVVLMAFIRDTFPGEREVGKIWETGA